MAPPPPPAVAAAAAAAAPLSTTARAPAAAAAARRWPRPLLIDNYDSYTYNLHQMIAEVYGVSPVVIRNDELPVEGVLELLERLRDEAAAAVVAAVSPSPPSSAPAAAPAPAPAPAAPPQKMQMPHVIISPGPGNPHVPSDAGVSVALFSHPAAARVPILGVCLGHQALAVAHGARVVPAEGGPVHGRLSCVRADPSHPLFAGCGPRPRSGGAGEREEDDAPPPQPPFRAVRYHSLAVDPASLPAGGPLRAVAWADVGGDEPVALRAVAGAESGGGEGMLPPLTPGHGQQQPRQEEKEERGQQQQQQQPNGGSSSSREQTIIMALAHADRPHCGVQFHPESIATAYGARVLANFRDLALASQGLAPGPPLPAAVALGPPGAALAPRPWPPPPPPAPMSAGALQGPPEWLFPQARTDDAAAARRRRRPLRLVWERKEGILPAGAAGAAACLPLFEAVVGGGGGGAGEAAAAAAAAAPGGGDDAFWLDSATAPERARFSFMGGGSRVAGSRGPLWHRVTYRVADEDEEGGGGGAAAAAAGTLSLERAGAPAAATLPPPAPPRCLWGYLRAATGPGVLNDADARAAALDLPFNFWGGAVGYLGYELGNETLPRPRGGGGSGGDGKGGSDNGPRPHARSPVPDAVLIFADRLVAVDHERGDVYALALHEDEYADEDDQDGESNNAAALRWVRAALAAATAAAAASPAAAPPSLPPSSSPPSSSDLPPSFALRHGRDEYVRNVASCLDALRQGDSYELCLTTALEARRRRSPPRVAGAAAAAPPPPVVDPWLFYRVLRAINPAPYSAWLRFLPSSSSASTSGAPSGRGPGLVVACSSPERFLRGDRGGVLEARPIKGTARRVPGDPAADDEAARALAASEKERSENLMIVDLLRNDLAEVCSPGSVHVPGLIELESYATVHQLVSTVRGLLRVDGQEQEEAGAAAGKGGGSSKGSSDSDSVAAVRAAFPGGSMTGAPKLRSCDILSRLEGRARGVYSGAIGYFSVAPGAPFDLNIVIRTACFYEEEGRQQQEEGEEKGAGAPGAAAAANGSNASDASNTTTTTTTTTEAVMSIGAGGAIVIQSDPDAEYAEMRLKASALVRAAAATWLLQQRGGGDGLASAAASSAGPVRLPPATEVDALAATLVSGGGGESD